MYSGWGKTTLKHEIGLWQLIRTRGIIHGTKPKHSSNVRRFSLKRPLCRLKTLLSGGRKKIKNPTGTKTKTIIRFALKKTVPLTNLVRKSDKNKHHASHMNEEIEFHMLHIPSKPPQFWSADFLQNDPLFTSNAGFNLIEGSSNETLVMHILRSVDNNEAKSYLTFKYCLPTSLLISYVETIFNHWSGEVGKSGVRLHRILTCISGEINIWM